MTYVNLSEVHGLIYSFIHSKCRWTHSFSRFTIQEVYKRRTVQHVSLFIQKSKEHEKEAYTLIHHALKHMMYDWKKKNLQPGFIQKHRNLQVWWSPTLFHFDPVRSSSEMRAQTCYLKTKGFPLSLALLCFPFCATPCLNTPTICTASPVDPFKTHFLLAISTNYPLSAF